MGLNKARVTIFVALFISLTVGCGNLTKDVHNLQADNERNKQAIALLQQQLASNVQVLQIIADDLLVLQQQGQTNADDIGQLQAMNIAMQGQVNAALVQLATLQGYTHITGLVNPCGGSAGYQEILLATSDGYVAYFENGGNRHLVLLKDGSYRTTDGTNCQFSINGGIYAE